METDYAIIGGGVVGLSIAWGLLRRGLSVTVIDGGDGDFRASRGNFGLVWVQGKGLNEPRYAEWTRASAAAWAGFAEELTGLTATDLGLRQDGGYELFFSEDDMAAMIAEYEGLRKKLGGDYPFEVLDPATLQKEEPAIGPKVVGAILHREDGHANPLRLLRALADATRRTGGHILTGRRVTAVDKANLFCLTCDDGTEIRSARLVLAAGLGAADLGPKLGFRTKVRPQRGQVMITEKLPKLINRPSPIARQVDEGGIQIGATNEEVGFDDGITRPGLARLAREAVDAWPDLARAQLVRSWGALRILTPDGLPVYQQSPDLPGAFLVTCHSGITLAAAHALMLPDWLEGQPGAPDLKVFSEDRFS
ncbi:NAD(P)/FAD-dependent oxidoreductase [Roseibium aggregatum]|uniref:FAD-binding oxidoreductase n=1 Tax=Roseibium aggregatum TaxID=187304 RepID=A0A926P3H6_9HYPH|nr:FAD-dependent oxidoreductase [Roseibium aggregatum]MBD1549571.1 FAD-binding oxidoreductase [Roseibium aggregatum]